MGEVVEGDDRLESPGQAQREDLGVALERGVVVVARARLQPGPLDRQPKGVATEDGGAVERLLGMAPEITGDARPFDAADVLPAGPVVVGLVYAVEAAFDLVARRRHADDETVPQQAR